jgi:hypothetical protein
MASSAPHHRVTAYWGSMPSPLPMPVSCELEGSVLLLHLTGTYSLGEMRASVAAALADPDRPRLTGLISDLRFSESIATRTLGDMTAIVGFLAYHASSLGNRIALLVPENSDVTLVKMAVVDLQTGGIDAASFRDIDDARAWLKR